MSEDQNNSNSIATRSEELVDEMEKRVLGQRQDQVRHEDDDPDEPAQKQDVDNDDTTEAVPPGPGSEPA
ncbi:MAG TPA: hypothetical protein VGH99_01075 [Pseudonocardia sp.]